MLKQGYYKFYEWDDAAFVLPPDYQLSDNSDLADALKVFYLTGGYDFFNVNNPKYYASHWLDFMGNLYKKIVEGKYISAEKHFVIPL
ncbi:MAG: hypothetical protein K2N24_09925, partial [Lachnospiraceae bacterium]|nr:hypothetical protein [Lachnospiraceae bacterium]